jgi:hypothetical protein
MPGDQEPDGGWDDGRGGSVRLQQQGGAHTPAFARIRAEPQNNLLCNVTAA